MKKAAINYTTNEGHEKTTILSFDIEDGAKVDGTGFDEAYEWEGETDEEAGLSDLVSFVTRNLLESGCEISSIA